jgi:membrane associated rhomboid family serine protease
MNQRFGEVPGLIPLTPLIKKIIVINVAVWLFLVLVPSFFSNVANQIFSIFGFVPFRFFTEFWLWQPFTYMFVHSPNVFHLVFNMLMLWFMGGEVENRLGKGFFLFYYLGCGAGAAIFYLLGVMVYYQFTGNVAIMETPVVGASGAIFGLLYAYGRLFGERIVSFMMIFPMRAKHFVMLLGAIEIMNLLSQGFGGTVSNLAHLAGILSGYLLLRFGPNLKDRWNRWRTRSHGRNLKLVVDNDLSNKGQRAPRYWN